jgi:predicted ATPase
MAVIGIAGLPGSGKSRLMDEWAAKGYSRYDDINMDWDANMAKLRAEAAQGRDAVVSDVLFCDETWRQKLERELDSPVQWVFFENQPWRCAKNCLFRFMFEDPNRSLQEMIINISQLAAVYRPHGDVRPVVRADKDMPDGAG